MNAGKRSIQFSGRMLQNAIPKPYAAFREISPSSLPGAIEELDDLMTSRRTWCMNMVATYRETKEAKYSRCGHCSASRIWVRLTDE